MVSPKNYMASVDLMIDTATVAWGPQHQSANSVVKGSPMRSIDSKRVALILTVLCSTACNDDEKLAAALVNVSDEPAGTNCEAGGSKVAYGVDEDSNGKLDNAEEQGSYLVCNGATGADAATGADGATGAQGGAGPTGAQGGAGPDGTVGLSALVKVSTESSGSNCTNGGQRIDSGIDSDGNETLDVSEVNSTVYVCNGENGAKGTSDLLLVTDEPWGENCQYGGQKIEEGPDTNGNEILDAGEIVSTGYVCNGSIDECDWSSASYTLPIVTNTTNGAYGELDFDKMCNLIVSGGGANLYRVALVDGSFDEISTASNVLGVAYLSPEGRNYVIHTSNIVARLNDDDSLTTVLTLPSGFWNSLTEIPPGFGAYGGMLAAVGTTSSFVAIDPSDWSTTVVGTTSGNLSSITFATDGSAAYIANHGSSKIQKVLPDGTFSDVMTGLSGIDGVRIGRDNNTLYAAQSSSPQRIIAVDIQAGTSSVVQTTPLGGGYYATGLIVDGSGDIIVHSAIVSGGGVDMITP